jgi:hypothetical protein
MLGYAIVFCRSSFFRIARPKLCAGAAIPLVQIPCGENGEVWTIE